MGIKLFGADGGEPIQVTTDDIGIPDVQATGGVLDSIVAQVFLAVGALAFLFLLIGAFRYVTSNGDASHIQQAKNTMLYSIIGVIIAVSAFVIIQFVADRVSGQ